MKYKLSTGFINYDRLLCFCAWGGINKKMMNNTKGFTEQIELHELREKCKELTLQLNVAKTYFELALDRTDPYPAIKDGLSRVNCALGHEA